MVLNQENATNSIRIRTAINDPNSPFLNYFFSKQENSVVLIRSAKYVDNIKGVEITIDFNDEMANILDWCYRGDPFANLELVCQLRTMNNNGEITLSDRLPFTFYSLETVDSIHDREYTRRNMQIPGAFFNKLNSFQLLQNFGTNLPQVMHLARFVNNSGCTIRFYDPNPTIPTTKVWSDETNFPNCLHPDLMDRLKEGLLACRRDGNGRWVPLTSSRNRLKEYGLIRGTGPDAVCNL
jgi:hypothetical protein